MKRTLLYILLGVFASTNLMAQDEEEVNEPVYEAFSGGMIIDNQTSYIPDVKSLEFVIQHKFGTVQNGRSDLWGVYAAATDIRLGLNYVPWQDVLIGVGISKSYMNTDFSVKWTPLKQTTNDKIPVFVTVYGNLAINGQERPFDQDLGFLDANRFSYFSQLIVGRKFNDWLSVQGGVSFAHANLVREEYDHDRVALHANGRFKVSPQGSIIWTLDAPLNIKRLSEQPSYQEVKHHPEPTLSFGFEIATFTHTFSIYMGNSSSILQQNTIMNNYNKIEKDNFAIGFTITRQWMF